MKPNPPVSRTSLENEVILAVTVLYLIIVGVMVVAHYGAMLLAEPATPAAVAGSSPSPEKD